MAKLTTLVITLFLITVSLYFVGFESPLSSMVDEIGAQESFASAFIDMLAKAFTSTDTLSKVGVGVGVIVIAGSIFGGSGSSFVIYALPLIFIGLFLNIFIFPIEAIAGAGMPQEVTWFVVLFLNLLSALAVLEFTRGGAA